MMIGMGLFWLAVIVGFLWLAGDGLRQRRPPLSETPLALLDRRFAEGAISSDDYHRRRDVLTGSARPGAAAAGHGGSKESER